MTKPTLSSFETFVATGRHGPPQNSRPQPSKSERLATDDELELTRLTLRVLVERYRLKRYAIMREAGVPNSSYPGYFSGTHKVPYKVLENLARLFLCQDVGHFLKLHETHPPKGLRGHLTVRDLVSPNPR